MMDWAEFTKLNAFLSIGIAIPDHDTISHETSYSTYVEVCW